MSHSTANLTTRELQSLMTVRFAYHSERKEVQTLLEERDEFLAQDDNQYFHHGGYMAAQAIEHAMNDRFGRRWWANHG